MVLTLSSLLAEEVGNKKLAAQYIYRELHEADEANLLDEEGDAVQTNVCFIGFQFNNVSLAPNYMGHSVFIVYDGTLVFLADMHVFGLKPMTDPLNLVSLSEL